MKGSHEKRFQARRGFLAEPGSPPRKIHSAWLLVSFSKSDTPALPEIANYPMMRIRPLGFLVISFLISVNALAQRTSDYDKVVVPQNRIDARDLGYPPIDILPNGESAIGSLTVAPNGNLYGATSGNRAHLFVLNPRHGYVQPLGFLPDTKSVTQALVVSAAGDVYIGTSPGGHLLKYTPQNEDRQLIKINEACIVTDVGQPLQGESIYALTIDRPANTLYGLTFPNAHFFKFSLKKGEFTDLGVVAGAVPEGEKFETEKMISRMLALDGKGNVYCSGENGSLFKFDQEQQQLGKLDLQAPAIPGREPWTRVDTFFPADSGVIYGGTADGYLFRFDPERLKVENLGKPLLQYRITGLVQGKNGKLYGVGGGEEDMVRMFSYDPVSGAYEILGFIDVNRRPYYSWQAYVIKSMAVGLDGTIYLGESERISKLYLFYPW
jgi:streptogramin lyase